ncbi:hypothetical protein [Paenibacillus naphthalenovorans]|uniref:hypothetical protein n=1 Tax=Paenibacillus naphthalenovorans TaxID=162209 RepID=UPI003D2B35E4
MAKEEQYITVDGERLRLVEREAVVGERVLIVNAVEDSFELYGYKNGEVYEIRSAYSGEPHIWPDGTEDSEIFLNEYEYRVLEPAESVKIDRTAELTAQVDGLTETVANLSVRLAAAERRLEAAECKLDEMERKSDAGPREIAKYEHVCSGKVNDGPPSFVKPLTRDDVIERAKADVAELITTDIPFMVPALSGEKQSFYPDTDGFLGACDVVEFVVNRDKRTVVALIREIDGEVWARGIAKCAPGDVFNTHIGRAISLRRALGLEVPDEYVNAPQPTEVKAGDVVRLRNGRLYTCRYSHKSLPVGEVHYDDSREEVSEN